MGALLLLADSQLLFRKDKAPGFHRMMQTRFADPVEMAYVGAANDNDPVFYELAREGVNSLLGRDCRSCFVHHESELPPPCPLVVLAGGNVAQGWQMIGQVSVRDWLMRCRDLADSVVMGISAGAIHLASGVDPEQPEKGVQTFLDWFPYRVAVHEENEGWPSLGGGEGVGIALGEGIWADGVEHRTLPF